MKKTVINAVLLVSLLVPCVGHAKTVEDFQTWGNVTATGSLGVISPDLQKKHLTNIAFGNKCFGAINLLALR